MVQFCVGIHSICSIYMCVRMREKAPREGTKASQWVYIFSSFCWKSNSYWLSHDYIKIILGKAQQIERRATNGVLRKERKPFLFLFFLCLWKKNLCGKPFTVGVDIKRRTGVNGRSQGDGKQPPYNGQAPILEVFSSPRRSEGSTFAHKQRSRSDDDAASR